MHSSSHVVNKQTLVIFSGLPGVGKSTLANRLARELQWTLLKIDDVIGKVPGDVGIEFWDAKVDVLMNLIHTQLELGLNVVVDSVFMNMDRQYAKKLAEKYGVRYLPIYVFVSDDKVWQERVVKRFDELDDKDVATWERIQHQREHFQEWLPNTALFIDSVNPVEENFKRALEFVKKDNIDLQPLPQKEIIQGRYHR